VTLQQASILAPNMAETVEKQVQIKKRIASNQLATKLHAQT
jgi:hypothetical protein